MRAGTSSPNRVGEMVITRGRFVFRCPVCHKRFTYNDRYEPMCTGPSETRDEHEPTVMIYVSREFHAR